MARDIVPLLCIGKLLVLAVTGTYASYDSAFCTRRPEWYIHDERFDLVLNTYVCSFGYANSMLGVKGTLSNLYRKIMLMTAI